MFPDILKPLLSQLLFTKEFRKQKNQQKKKKKNILIQPNDIQQQSNSNPNPTQSNSPKTQSKIQPETQFNPSLTLHGFNTTSTEQQQSPYNSITQHKHNLPKKILQTNPIQPTPKHFPKHSSEPSSKTPIVSHQSDHSTLSLTPATLINNQTKSSSQKNERQGKKLDPDTLSLIEGLSSVPLLKPLRVVLNAAAQKGYDISPYRHFLP